MRKPNKILAQVLKRHVFWSPGRSHSQRGPAKLEHCHLGRGIQIRIEVPDTVFKCSIFPELHVAEATTLQTEVKILDTGTCPNCIEALNTEGLWALAQLWTNVEGPRARFTYMELYTEYVTMCRLVCAVHVL